MVLRARTHPKPVPPRGTEAPPWVVGIAFVGAVAALTGGYWDDAWHTDRGRDSFFVAPHIAIYAGIAGAGGALVLWAAMAARAGGGLRAVASHRPLALALLSVGVTLASGPIDNAWHVAFGRDAVAWSPPHMLGIAGTVALGAAILAEFAQRTRRSSRIVTAVAGALVLAAATFSVFEYDTDVPQFDTAWYLPVLALSACVAFAIVRLASNRRYAATEAAAVHLAFIAAVALFLLVGDFPVPGLPVLVPAALALDLAARARWPPLARAAAFTAALYVAYVPVRNWLGDGVFIDADDVLLGAPVALLASWIVLAAAEGGLSQPPRRSAAVAASLAVLAALVAAPAVFAHDPGQGRDAGELDLTVTARDRTLSLEGVARGAGCRGLEGRAVAARREGQLIRAPLQLDDCRLTGQVRVPERGRWFVYAELRRDDRDVEAWLPIQAADGTRRVSEHGRYAYQPEDSSAGAVQLVTGAVLYSAMAALILATFALVRPARAA